MPSGVPALRSTISFWIAIAHSTAATTEGNSSRSPSPVVLTMRPPKLRHDRPRRLAMLAHRPRRPRLVLAHQARVADDVDGEDRGEPAGGGHCSGTPALRRPSRMGSSWARYVGSSLIAVQAARAREMEKVGLSARPALTAESRLVQSAKLREGGGQHKMWMRIISVGLDRPPKPRDRLLPTAEVELRHARVDHPDVSQRIARTEAQGLGNVSLGFFGATDKNLTTSDNGMGVGEISIQRQRMFAFGDALCGALGQDVDNSQEQMGARMVRDRRQGFGQLRFGRGEGRRGIGHKEKCACSSRPRAPIQ